jgi:hypothetical protein
MPAEAVTPLGGSAVRVASRSVTAWAERFPVHNAGPPTTNRPARLDTIRSRWDDAARGGAASRPVDSG